MAERPGRYRHRGPFQFFGALIDALVEFAEHQFSLNARQKDGSTLRDTLESVYRQKGKMPEQLQPVEIPEPILYLWTWFCDLSGARQYGMNGPLPIAYSEIESWKNLKHTDPEPWEVDVLNRIDRVYIMEANKKA